MAVVFESVPGVRILRACPMPLPPPGQWRRRFRPPLCFAAVGREAGSHEPGKACSAGPFPPEFEPVLCTADRGRQGPATLARTGRAKRNPCESTKRWPRHGSRKGVSAGVRPAHPADARGARFALRRTAFGKVSGPGCGGRQGPGFTFRCPGGSLRNGKRMRACQPVGSSGVVASGLEGQTRDAQARRERP